MTHTNPHQPAARYLLPDGPRPASRYDYLLGGNDNLHDDRASAQALAAVFPDVGTAVHELRRSSAATLSLRRTRCDCPPPPRITFVGAVLRTNFPPSATCATPPGAPTVYPADTQQETRA